MQTSIIEAQTPEQDYKTKDLESHEICDKSNVFEVANSSFLILQLM